MNTALHGETAASAAVMGEYHGAEAVARFGDVRSEFEVLRSGCGIYNVSWRSKIRITGRDRVRWLNGMVTNNVRDLAVNRGVYCFLLNAQGRIHGDMFAFNRGDGLLIDTDRDQRDHLLEIFEKYIIMDDVELALEERLSAVAVRGPKCEDVLRKIGIDTGELQTLEIRDTRLRGHDASLLRTDGVNTFELWIAAEQFSFLWNAVLEAGGVPVGYQAVELARIAAGIPAYGQDIRERDLPQETGQQRALHFQKGCYVGQEIVERIHSRGNVHRMFTGFRFDGAPPGPGTKIEAGGKEAGEITSSATLPTSAGERHVGLGYIRREATAGEPELRAGNIRLKIAKLPFETL